MPFLDRPDGARLYHELHGPTDRSALVLLEGMGGDIAGWRRNVPHLAVDHRVVAWDLRGNGRSLLGTVPEDVPMGIETFVDDTLALLDELGIERAHLYGQSFGGMIAQEFALNHPGRVRALVLAATHGGRAHLVPVPANRRTAPNDRPWITLYAPGFPEAHPEHVAGDLASGTGQEPVARRRQWEAIQTFDSFDRLGSIHAPTLVLHGAQDRMIDPRNARLLAERIPGARLETLEGAGHVYHSEQADRSDALVLAFLRSHDDA
ncbi:MAG: alpha/beta fold hydrolase [Actinomycetota bacterium]